MRVIHRERKGTRGRGINDNYDNNVIPCTCNVTDVEDHLFARRLEKCVWARPTDRWLPKLFRAVAAAQCRSQVRFLGIIPALSERVLLPSSFVDLRIFLCPSNGEPAQV